MWEKRDDCDALFYMGHNNVYYYSVVLIFNLSFFENRNTNADAVYKFSIELLRCLFVLIKFISIESGKYTYIYLVNDFSEITFPLLSKQMFIIVFFAYSLLHMMFFCTLLSRKMCECAKIRTGNKIVQYYKFIC